VRVVDEPEVGVCAARQRGAEAARGDIIVSTDADTVHPANWLRSINANFSDSSVVAVAGPCRFENAKGWIKGYPGLLFGLVARVFAMTGFVFYVSATNLAMRRTAFPGYDTKQTQGGDELDVLRRIRKRGVVVWDQNNVVTTSPRRLQRGFLYNFFVTFLTYYLMAYALNRLPGRRKLGMAPVVRPPLFARNAGPGRSASGFPPPHRRLRLVHAVHGELRAAELADSATDPRSEAAAVSREAHGG
jgi:glycosyltransferase involved in cell wall biosynthesis